MARRDIAGLLTGVPSNFAETMIRSGQVAGDVQGGRLRGMFSGGKQGYLSDRETVQVGLRNFDELSEEKKRNVIRAAQALGETTLAGQLLSQLQKEQKVSQETELRGNLVRVAEAQDNQPMVDFLNAGGSLAVASNKLFKDKTTPSIPSYSLTDTDEDEYDLYFADYDRKYLKSIGYDTPFFGKIEKEDKTRLFLTAERLLAEANKRGENIGGREGALKQALLLKASGQKLDVPVDSGPKPRGQQDKFGSVKE